MKYFPKLLLSLLLVGLFAWSGKHVLISSATRSESGTAKRFSAVNRSPMKIEASEVPPVYTYKIVNTFPHDPNAFTQGLVFKGGVIYEGTGLLGRSELRKVDLVTGDVLQHRNLPAYLFGEGVTAYENRLIQLTWKAGVGLVYDRASFGLIKEFRYSTEGWGITHDGKRLIMSDGTSTLRFLDPQTFAEIGLIEVYDRTDPVIKLNELEYVQGEVFANVWRTDLIARIAPETGRVVGWIDLAGLLKPEDRIPATGVLNGIAYDPANDRLFVTGKLWPKLFEIKPVLREG
ncbi:MAG: glutaminyl-peptide cyclotransferase [Deltaproteobacteria bacterium]|nr:MAG: glutaminyl-peptide cyclotransferase [Deltaproteobacteria bacterium]